MLEKFELSTPYGAVRVHVALPTPEQPYHQIAYIGHPEGVEGEQTLVPAYAGCRLGVRALRAALRALGTKFPGVTHMRAYRVTGLHRHGDYDGEWVEFRIGN